MNPDQCPACKGGVGMDSAEVRQEVLRKYPAYREEKNAIN